MPSVYTTIQGDTWDIIAFKTVGDEYLMSEIIDANLDHRETVIFSAGVTLIIPDTEVTESQPLPPWKREE